MLVHELLFHDQSVEKKKEYCKLEALGNMGHFASACSAQTSLGAGHVASISELVFGELRSPWQHLQTRTV